MQEPSRNSGEQLESEQLPVGDFRQPLCPGRNSPAASTEQGLLSHAPSLASLFLSHVLTNMNCGAEGRKVLTSQWKTVTEWTGNACV